MSPSAVSCRIDGTRTDVSFFYPHLVGVLDTSEIKHKYCRMGNEKFHALILHLFETAVST